PVLVTPSRGHPAAAPSNVAPRAKRTNPASAPPPVAVQTLRAHGSSVVPPPGTPSRPHPSSVPPPLTSQVPLSSAPMPVVPSGYHAAPRAPGQGTAQLPVDPRHGPAQPLVTERVSSAPESVISSQTSHLTVV